MAIRICASGFGEDWDGTYEQIDSDNYAKVPDQDYWIYRDSWFWYISESAYKYDEQRAKAKKVYVRTIVDPTGNYIGIDGEPSGTVSSGEC
jgi:hypothetical protein